jgi:hypothetical protein
LGTLVVVTGAFAALVGTVVVLEGGGVVVVVEFPVFAGGAVVVVVDPLPPLPLPSTAIGVVDPGWGCQPGGGWVCDGTLPAAGTTVGAAGFAAVGC